MTFTQNQINNHWLRIKLTN